MSIICSGPWVRAGALALAVLMCSASGTARAEYIVLANALAGVEGNTALNVIIDQASNTRFQQVYAATEFGSVGGPLLITQLAFRPSVVPRPFTHLVPDIQFNLSTTGAMPGALSLTYANNVGADDTMVFTRGALNFSSAAVGPPGGPLAFDILVPFHTPFLYDPAAGNLLLDVRHFSADLPLFNIALDADNRHVTLSHLRGFANSPNGSVAEPLALVTQFQYEAAPGGAVPAPPGVALMAVGGLVLFARRRLRAAIG